MREQNSDLVRDCEKVKTACAGSVQWAQSRPGLLLPPCWEHYFTVVAPWFRIAQKRGFVLRVSSSSLYRGLPFDDIEVATPGVAAHFGLKAYSTADVHPATLPADFNPNVTCEAIWEWLDELNMLAAMLRACGTYRQKFGTYPDLRGLKKSPVQCFKHALDAVQMNERVTVFADAIRGDGLPILTVAAIIADEDGTYQQPEAARCERCYSSCDGCHNCQRCDSSCDGCQSSCYSCNSCNSCVSCQSCHSCDACMDCHNHIG